MKCIKNKNKSISLCFLTKSIDSPVTCGNMSCSPQSCVDIEGLGRCIDVITTDPTPQSSDGKKIFIFETIN